MCQVVFVGQTQPASPPLPLLPPPPRPCPNTLTLHPPSSLPTPGTHANGSSNGNGSHSKTQSGGSGACQSICTLLIGLLGILLSGAITLSHYPPRSFPRVSVRDEFLSEAGGNFTNLSKGRVHYVLREPVEPSPLPPVVLIHGFSMGCVIWNEVAEALVERANRRVLTFDLFGRGYSDAAFPCDLELFTGQLSELLFSLQPLLGPGPYDILGRLN